jgi:hypothetical protein
MELNTMNFGEALAALKSGKRVARAGWNGKGMWLQYIGADQWHARITGDRDMQISADIAPLPWIGMKTADDKFVPWLASQTDMLAEDWLVVA